MMGCRWVGKSFTIAIKIFLHQWQTSFPSEQYYYKSNNSIKMEKHPKKTVFFIGKTKHETERKELSPREILVDFAKVSLDNFTLALKSQGGFDELTYLDQPIEMKEGMHFVLFDKTPTTVS